MARVSEQICRSSAETFELGAALGKQVQPNAVLLLYGDLGAGKTEFVKGFVSAIFADPIEVTSPTYTYLNTYTGESRKQLLTTVYHFDLYRLRNLEEFLSMGFDELLEAGAFCCIEWAEKLHGLDLPHAIKVHIKHIANDLRSISLHA